MTNIEKIQNWRDEHPNTELTASKLRGVLGIDSLRFAELRGADLSGADLSGADMHFAELRDADLTGTDMRGADLRYADMRRVDLRDAVLRYADMRHTKLDGADLRDSHEGESAVHITSPRLVANGAGAWSGTVEEYDAEVLQHDGRFHRVVLERAVEGVFGEDVAAMIEDGDESLLPATLSEVAQALSREELAEFCEHLFDDPNVTLG